ncbi:MAG: hypothetical protein JSW23_05460 [Planctomycetota bacterium]|nr:MAG: hypothetical protein JSW23_05460 [Planctomycetota bacterium]
MGSITGHNYVGGLAGTNYGDIVGCRAVGSVSGHAKIGGLIGGNFARVSNCYSMGSASATVDDVGGWVGYHETGGEISKCFSTGQASGSSFVGGLLGESWGVVSDSFWDVNSSGMDTSDGGTGLTTVEMQTRSTFTDAGWDFVGELINGPNDIWDICEGTNYPKLVWSIPAGDFVCPDGVTLVDYSCFAGSWYAGPGDGNWDPNCDISEPNDNVIDGLDLKVFVGNWLEGI